MPARLGRTLTDVASEPKGQVRRADQVPRPTRDIVLKMLMQSAQELLCDKSTPTAESITTE
jgi:hypothetical protein